MQTRYDKNRSVPGVLPSGYEGTNTATNFELPSCGIEDVDRAFFELFDRVLPFSYRAQKDSESRRVPVVFASGERWALASKKSPIRDKSGSLILPIISISRSGIEQTATKGLGVSEFFNEMVVRKRLADDDPLFQALRGADGLRNTGRTLTATEDGTDYYRETGRLLQPRMGPAIYETLVIPMPKYFTVKYEITMWAQYVGQLNAMVTTLLGAYVNGHRSIKVTTSKGYWFVAYFDAAVTNGSNLDSFTDDERLVKASLTAEVPGYLILPEVDGVPRAIKSFLSAPTVSFGDFSGDSRLTQVTPVVSGKVESFTLSDVATSDNERPSGAVGEDPNTQSIAFAGGDPDGASVTLVDTKPTTSPVGGVGSPKSRTRRVTYDIDPVTGRRARTTVQIVSAVPEKGEETFLIDDLTKL